MKSVLRATLIVCALLVIAGVILLFMPTIVHHPNTQESIARIQIQDTFKTALVRYRIDCGRFPTTAEGLDALLQAPAGQSHWKGSYLTVAKIPRDPWDGPYHYRSPGEKSSLGYDLWSEARDIGSDQDDIVSW